MVIRIKKESMKKGSEMAVKEKRIMIRYEKQGKEKWRIVGVYVNGDIEQKLQKIGH